VKEREQYELTDLSEQRFKGAEHIVRLVAASEDGPQYSDIFRKPMAVTSKLWRIARRSPKRSRNSPDRTWTDDYASLLKGLRGPVLVMEYFENGSLGSLREKLKSDDVLLPNRMLWAFCLCGESFVLR
jgi:hypothetical protein